MVNSEKRAKIVEVNAKDRIEATVDGKEVDFNGTKEVFLVEDNRVKSNYLRLAFTTVDGCCLTSTNVTLVVKIMHSTGVNLNST